MDRKEIDRIGPLTFMQNALLMHSLTAEKDLGVILVKAKIHGGVDKDLFQQAWNYVLSRHEALRTSIHWEKVSKPLQVVHKQVTFKVIFDDHTQLTDHESEERQSQIFEEKPDLSKAPIIRVVLIRLGDQEYQLLWQCHHILVDGWSSGVVLRDLVDIYKDLIEGTVVQNTPPTSLIKAFSDSDTDDVQTEKYWREQLKGYDIPRLFAQQSTVDKKFESIDSQLSNEVSGRLKAYAKEIGVTINTIFQGCWGLVLQQYFDTKDIITGVTLSGRLKPSDIDTNSMVGMLMNVLPLRVRDDQDDIKSFFHQVFTNQAELVEYERLDLDKVLYYKNWSGNLNLFDNLIVFENFPNESVEGGGIKLDSFHSDFTTSYNLNLLVKPSGSIRFSIVYNQAAVTTELAEEIKQNFVRILEALSIGGNITSSQQLVKKLKFQHKPVEYGSSEKEAKKSAYEKVLVFDRNIEGTKRSALRKRPEAKAYEAPETSQQLVISQLWEDLFGFQPVGVKDNFFELGGTSMMAVQLFAQIEKNFGVSLSPTVLIGSPTIEDLDVIINSSEKGEQWAAVVPLRKTGSMPPLFCLHAGGAHVLFYNDLAKHLGPDQPVYAIQPIGLENIEKAHGSIEEMASFYIEEIRKVEPTGPYALLGTCFSDAVALEISLQLEKLGEKVHPLIIVDSEPVGIKRVDYSHSEKFGMYLRALSQFRFQFLFKKVVSFLKFYIGSPDRMIIEKGYEKYESEKKLQLMNLEQMRSNLFNLYESYTWKKYMQDVIFIQSEDFGEINRQESLVQMWREVIDGEIQIETVRGHHLTIFEEPTVQHLSEKVRDCLMN